MPTATLPASRFVERLVAAGVALLCLSFARTGWGLVPRAMRDGRLGVAIGAGALLILFVALGAWQAWLAWRGWTRSHESRSARLLRLAAAGFLLWGLLGSALIVGFIALFAGRDAGVAPVLAWLSAPIGALLGAVVARRGSRGSRGQSR